MQGSSAAWQERQELGDEVLQLAEGWDSSAAWQVSQVLGDEVLVQELVCCYVCGEDLKIHLMFDGVCADVVILLNLFCDG